MAKKSSENKQDLFIAELLRDPKRNATKAAIAAGYSKATAAQAGARLLRNVKVREKIDAIDSKRLEDLGIDGKRVLRGIAQLAFYDTRLFFTADGKLKPIGELDETCAMAIKGVDFDTVVNSYSVRPIDEKAAPGDVPKEVAEAVKKAKPAKGKESDEAPEPTHELVRETRTITTKIRFADRGENLERLGRHLKLFTDRLEFEDKTPYDPKRDDARIGQLLTQAVRAAAHTAQS